MTTTASDNPHEAILLELSPQARVAWQEALDGSDISHPGGCRAAAYAELSISDPVVSQVSLLAPAFEIFMSDAVTIDFYESWESCVAAEGYQFETPRDSEIQWREDAEQLTAELVQEAIDSAETAEGLTQRMVELEGGEAVAELQQREIRFAQSSLACGVGPPYLGNPDELADIWADAIRQAQDASG